MNRSHIDWRNYSSTLGLAILMQGRMTELLAASHAGDADTTIEAAAELREMIGALLSDFGATAPPTRRGCRRPTARVTPEGLTQCAGCPHARAVTVAFECASCGETKPVSELEIGPEPECAQWCSACLLAHRNQHVSGPQLRWQIEPRRKEHDHLVMLDDHAPLVSVRRREREDRGESEALLVATVIAEALGRELIRCCSCGALANRFVLHQDANPLVGGLVANDRCVRCTSEVSDAGA